MAKPDKSNATYLISSNTRSKLAELKAYHCKSYNDLVELIVDNAHLKMSELLNEDKVKSLTESDNNQSFQIQQLTLMFGAYKAELEKFKIKVEHLEDENSQLKSIVNEQVGKHNTLIETVEKIEKASTDRMNKHSARITALEQQDKKGFLSKITG